MQDLQDLEPVRAKYLAEVAAAADEPAIEAVRIAALGKKGEVALMMRGLGRMTPEERQAEYEKRWEAGGLGFMGA